MAHMYSLAFERLRWEDHLSPRMEEGGRDRERKTQKQRETERERE
jgi:hypothetical protein